MPENEFKTSGPLKDLFKDEVRRVGSIVTRQVIWNLRTGLANRIGEVTEENYLF